MRIALHRAGVSDIPSLAVLWTTMVEHHRRVVGGQWPVRVADEAWARRREQYSAWLSEDTGFIFIAYAEDSDNPVGYAACRLLPAGPTFDLGEPRGDVDSLVTAERVRGRGVGSALLSACRNELRRRGARYWSIGVVEANTGAIELYERLGFRPFVRSMLAAIDESPQAVEAGDA
ncbi:MAG: GNAT family N-acetyltransferase [Solirubrobacterales bacterium]|nr:GNAT family N-acetyltransferase [Solirubrobacterales bacterium]